jgi:hypothetical protein
MKPLTAGMTTASAASPPAEFPSLPLCSVDEAELRPKTPPVALSSLAPDLWVSADNNDESD